MAKFFIHRPIFAWVIAIAIIVMGLVSVYQIPINMYPNIAPPTVNISVTYPGASASDLDNSVIAVIEEEMNGLSGLVDIESKSESNGIGNINLRFTSGSDDRIAQVEVQNRLQRATPRLPSQVIQQGLIVSRSGTSTLLYVSLTSNSQDLSIADVSDYMARNIIPEIRRIHGIGSIQQFGSERAMRIWLDANKLAGFNLTATDVVNAIQGQNIQISAGSIGDNPNTNEQTFTASLAIDGLLSNEQQFGNIIIHANTDGSAVRVKDVANISFGGQTYMFSAFDNGKPSSGFMVSLANDGNALDVSKAVNKKLKQLEKFFPQGMKWDIPFDSSKFIATSISQVSQTLLEATALVFLVMLLFLQNLRYAIIATIVVPISLLGAVAVLYSFGFSINVLSMFALALVIGIVVDDAIVVVENVDRIMSEEHLPPLQAAIKAMKQISGAIIGVTVVLLSVFLPLFFFTGTTGNIYRQFAATMSAAIAFSAFMALSLTPALCATFLKQKKSALHSGNKLLNWFNTGFIKTSVGYAHFLNKILTRSFRLMMIYLLIIIFVAWSYSKLPTGLVPAEDQGILLASAQLPANATSERTKKTLEIMTSHLANKPEIENIIAVTGFSFFGAGQNAGFLFITLKDWKQRKQANQSAQALADTITKELSQLVHDAFIVITPPPSITGLSAGLDIRVQDRNNKGHEALTNARNQMLGMMMQNKKFLNTYPDGLPDSSQIKLTIDREKAATLGISFADIGKVLSTSLSSNYVNNFMNQGRLQRVIVQNSTDSRMQPESILQLQVKNNLGENVPLASFASISWQQGPVQAVRYNGYPTMKIGSTAATGISDGQAIAEVEKLAAKLPAGFGIEWGGMSKEQKDSGNQAIILYAFTILAVFLCLAALYESWSIPFSVILVVPLGILGVVLMTMARGMSNDIYFQVGLVTIIGLAAKNAILIIEFAKDLQQQGATAIHAALQASQMRFRPIIMTSIAFTFGILPLFFASGAGSASRRAVGTGVFGGMISGTLLAIFFVPIFFVVVRSIFKGNKLADKELEELHND